MSRIVFDIETLGYPIETFDEVRQEYLLKFSKTEEEKNEAIQKLSLHAATAQIITIAMYNPDTNGGKVFYQSNVAEQFFSDDGKVEFLSGDERQLLERFWDNVQHYDQFITFNGRSFDCPFVMLRSAILSIQPTRNLMPYRYDSKIHCDLLEQLTFYNTTRKFNLDFFCKTFGIKSPKAEGITGLDLAPLYHDGKFKEIAQYCLGDVQATAELFRRWEKFLNIKE